MNQTTQAIFQTLAYADVFDYPLTAEELYQFLISDKSSTPSAFKKALTLNNPDLKLINNDGKYYFLKDREKNVALRKQRERWSRKKLKIAGKVASWLKLIPWVKMVGVTGSLAIGNSDEADDIDILIVSSPNRLWLTRFLVTALVELTGQRRRPPKTPEISLLPKSDICPKLSTEKHRDKICLNMFLDEDHLAVPEKERDLFSAHEVCQMRLLWDRDDTYSKFINRNSWVRRFLANTLNIKMKIENRKKTKKKENIFYTFLILICNFSLFIFNFSFVEKLAKVFQLWYMAKRRTTEVISDGIIRFHPKDARNWVLTRYKNLLK